MKYLSYALAVFVASLIGGTYPLLQGQIPERKLKLAISLGAGLLLGMALLHLLPEAAHLNPSYFAVAFFLGFLVLFLLERFLMVHACEEHHCDFHTVGMAAFAGLAVHGVIEGVAIASALRLSTMAWFVLLAIAVHKVPASFTLTSLLQMARKPRSRILWFTVGVALASPFGVALGAYLLEGTDYAPLSGFLLGVSAGTFLYIAACDLLPQLHRTSDDKWPRLALFLLGVGLSLIGSTLADTFGHV